MSQTAYRTHHATEVTEQLVGQKVTLAGWVDRRRDHGGVAFIDLRDNTGLVQVVIYDEEMARPLRSEFVIQVVGEVRLRPDGNENEHLATGKIEVVAESIEVLAKSDALPFQVSTALENESENKLPGEDVRLKYRYLDLRRPSMQRNLKLRAQMSKAARHALEEMGFEEIETPTMIKSTPEGARDFVVPARLVPGSWYALPQSPQLLKQLLMVSGVERYYQLARCYRDEDFRADRQPEFTQLDMEMAFVDQEDVMAMAEKVIAAIWKSAGYDIKLPIQRITWQDAMDKYGSDKPDLRFGNPLIELTDYFKNTPFRVFQAPYVGAVLFKGGAATPRRQFDAWQDWAKQRGAKGLAYVVFAENGELKGPVAKNLSEEERNGLKEAVGAEDGDAVFFAAGRRTSSQELLGAVRVELARRAGLLKPDDFAFTWVVDFPLFKPTDDPDDDDVAVGHPSGPPCITRSPCRPRIGSTSSTRIRNTPCPIPTTSCATATKWVAAPCVSTATTFRTVCLTCLASRRKRPQTSSASCLRHSSTALRLTPASLSAGIVPPQFWLAPTPSATSSPSRRLAAAAIR